MVVLGCMTATVLAQAEALPDAVAARVNHVDITRQQVQTEVQQIRLEAAFRNRPLTDNQTTAIRPQVLETLIERALLLQQAQQREITVRSRWVDRALEELQDQLKEQKMPMEAYLARIGLSEPQLKEKIRNGLIVQRILRREVLRRIKVSEAEMQVFYQEHPEFFQREEQVRARHLLIAVAPDADEQERNQALERMRALQARLAEGAQFGVLALEHSHGPSSQRGGDLGYFTRRQILPAIGEAAFSLPIGATSDVITTRHGYHLLEVLDRRPPAKTAYKNSRKKIERTLRRNKEKEAIETFMAGLKAKATILRNTI